MRGIIESGAGKGAFFVGLEWVKEQIGSQMGFVPYPGTLNVRIQPEDVSTLERMIQEHDGRLIPTDPAFCTAGLKRISLSGVPGAIVLPSKDVRIHDSLVIEIITDRDMKQSLGLRDGDAVTIEDVRPSGDSVAGQG